MKRFPEYILVPSILAADHAHLARGMREVEALDLPWLHIDIMDGHFVPNLTFGPGVVAALRTESSLFFDVHLMLDNPDRYVESFAKAGADLISIHVEPEYDHSGTLRRIRDLGRRNGIVLNPDTPVESVQPYLEHVDLVLAMTVEPGFGGQSFREDVLPKLAFLANYRKEKNLDFRIEVDGGINLETGQRCRSSGADTFVAGTSFFGAEDKSGLLEGIVNRNT